MCTEGSRFSTKISQKNQKPIERHVNCTNQFLGVIANSNAPSPPPKTTHQH